MRKGLLVLMLCLAVLCGGCRQNSPSDDPSGSFQLPLTSLYQLDEYGVWVWVGLSECAQSEDDLWALLSDADSLVVNGMEREGTYISADSEDGQQWLSELGQNEVGTFFTNGGPEIFWNLPPCVEISSHSLRCWRILPIKDGHFYAQDMIAALKKSDHSMYFDVDQPDPSLRIYFQDGCTDQELYAGIEQMLESERPSFPPLP